MDSWGTRVRQRWIRRAGNDYDGTEYRPLMTCVVCLVGCHSRTLTNSPKAIGSRTKADFESPGIGARPAREPCASARTSTLSFWAWTWAIPTSPRPRGTRPTMARSGESRLRWRQAISNLDARDMATSAGAIGRLRFRRSITHSILGRYATSHSEKAGLCRRAIAYFVAPSRAGEWHEAENSTPDYSLRQRETCAQRSIFSIAIRRCAGSSPA